MAAYEYCTRWQCLGTNLASGSRDCTVWEISSTEHMSASVSIIGRTSASIPIMEDLRLEFGKPLSEMYDCISIHPVLKVIIDNIRSQALTVDDPAKEFRRRSSFTRKVWLKRHLEKGTLPRRYVDTSTFGALLCLLRNYLKHLPVSILGSDKLPTEDLYPFWILIGNSCLISLRQVQGGICGTLLQDIRRPLSFCTPQSLMLLKELMSLLSDISQMPVKSRHSRSPWSRLRVLSRFLSPAMLRPHTSKQNLNHNDCVLRNALVRFLVIHHQLIFNDIVMSVPEDPRLLSAMPSYHKRLEVLQEVEEMPCLLAEPSTCASIDVPNVLTVGGSVAQNREFLSEPYFPKDSVAKNKTNSLVRSCTQLFRRGSGDGTQKNQETTTKKKKKKSRSTFWCRIQAWLGLRKSAFELKRKRNVMKRKCDALKGATQDKCCVLCHHMHEFTPFHGTQGSTNCTWITSGASIEESPTALPEDPPGFVYCWKDVASPEVSPREQPIVRTLYPEARKSQEEDGYATDSSGTNEEDEDGEIVHQVRVEVHVSGGGEGSNPDEQEGTVRVHVVNEIGDNPQADKKDPEKAAEEFGGGTLATDDVGDGTFVADEVGDGIFVTEDVEEGTHATDDVRDWTFATDDASLVTGRKSASADLCPGSLSITISEVDAFIIENGFLQQQKELTGSSVSLLDSSVENGGNFSLANSSEERVERPPFDECSFASIQEKEIAVYLRTSEEVQMSEASAVMGKVEELMSPTQDMEAFERSDSNENMDTKGAPEHVPMEENDKCFQVPSVTLDFPQMQ